MKFNLIIAVPMLYLASCTSITANKVTSLSEPLRSKFMVSCMLQGNFTLTTCLCHEKTIMELLKGDETKFKGFTPKLIDLLSRKCQNKNIVEEEDVIG